MFVKTLILRDLRCFGKLYSVQWQFRTDVPGQYIGPTLQDQEIEIEISLLGFLDPVRSGR